MQSRKNAEPKKPWPRRKLQKRPLSGSILPPLDQPETLHIIPPPECFAKTAKMAHIDEPCQAH